MKLGKEYDVIMAGELIEHLSNPGLFLERIKVHLKKTGVFIVTTPNAFSIRNVLRSLLLGWVPTNREHVSWYCIKTLSFLLKRHGFTIKERAYYFDQNNGWRFRLERFFSFFRNSFAPEMLFVVKRK
jgi:2-polyprenyl-3-methyl-5-hydroxy-6-metoxy-1,4-benzoquinol methylase